MHAKAEKEVGLSFITRETKLMRDLLSGNGSEVTKAVLVNACAVKRNAQLVSGQDGQGLALLLDATPDGGDLMVAKIVRCIASHEGPTHDISMPRLLEVGMKYSALQKDESATLSLEFIGVAALIKVADWSRWFADIANRWFGESRATTDFVKLCSHMVGSTV
ncbi:hypothetical protein KIN20_032550 [Parelaphostrongylus tenuis]|uniref:Uncharacterized protein n=1 Tax=Parelaphostrongylus tenuis TaxID=148309 RepID=A0AAD5WI40_PARTN|nr:hypothetical protein KIN20_032550 [Parelaphostrongylus tenuis]